MSPLKNLCRNVLTRLGYEVYRRPAPWTLRHDLTRILEDFEIDCVLDVGALHGSFGDMLRALGYRERIVSFEPMPESFEQLQRHIAGDPSWEAHRMALGDRSGHQTFYVLGGSDLCSFNQPNDLCVELFLERGKVEREMAVPVQTLKQTLDDLGLADTSRLLLKLDTQGWDLRILRDAPELLARFRAIQIEVVVQPIYTNLPRYHRVLEFMENHGFRLAGFHPMNSRNGGAIIEADCLFVAAPRNGTPARLPAAADARRVNGQPHPGAARRGRRSRRRRVEPQPQAPGAGRHRRRPRRVPENS